METGEIDGAKAHEFARRFTEIINGASLALVCNVGHQTGLFDAMASLQACTSEELAEASRLNERYVSEWLATMTVGRKRVEGNVFNSFYIRRS